MSFKEHFQYAQDVLYVMKNIDSGNVGNNRSVTFSHKGPIDGTTWVRHNDAAIARFDNKSNDEFSMCPASSGLIRYYKNGNGVKIYNNGRVETIFNDDPVLIVSEEQYFQNSLIYPHEEQLLTFLMYGTLRTYEFNNGYIMLSLHCLEMLKKSMECKV